MKKILLVSILALLVCQGFSQPPKGVSYFNWSNPTSFEVSTPPRVVGYGVLSSTLSKTFNVDFFVFGDEYFKIDTWASYYYWFTQRYFYLFDQPDLYEFFYETKNDRGMVKFIAEHYRGKSLPSKINFRGISSNKAILAKGNSVNSVSLNEDIEKGYSKVNEDNYLKRRKEIKRIDEQKKATQLKDHNRELVNPNKINSGKSSRSRSSGVNSNTQLKKGSSTLGGSGVKSKGTIQSGN